MIASYGTTITIFSIVLWAFLYFSPKATNKSKVVRFNLATLLIAVAVSAIWTLYLYLGMKSGGDFGWWPVASLLSSFWLSSGIIALSGLIRNYIVFRSNGRP